MATHSHPPTPPLTSPWTPASGRCPVKLRLEAKSNSSRIAATLNADWTARAASCGLETSSSRVHRGQLTGTMATGATYLLRADIYAGPGNGGQTGQCGECLRLPAGISDVTTIDSNIGMWSGNGNFGQMQDPANGNALTAAPVLANSAGTRQFTISRVTSEAWRLTLMTASGDGEGTLYKCDRHRAEPATHRQRV
jgi:hypothetical protein